MNSHEFHPGSRDEMGSSCHELQDLSENNCHSGCIPLNDFCPRFLSSCIFYSESEFLRLLRSKGYCQLVIVQSCEGLCTYPDPPLKSNSSLQTIVTGGALAAMSSSAKVESMASLTILASSFEKRLPFVHTT